MLKKLFNFFRSERDHFTDKKTTLPEKTKVRTEKLYFDVGPKPEQAPKEKIENLFALVENYKEYCLEKTSNQHNMKVSHYKIIDKDDMTETFKITGDAFIFHNEHKTLRIESEYFVKYIQQEYNPLTQLLENAYD
ncbi:hypothetical protein HNP38_003255 [Chryseobacterium defluvii]|uniref:Uncharacterized protein n=1 Tax=Chryseobacterium defluvii TaxID=160396 RepID=A0A840KEF4_9FLAO|nr:hypothetical protein [Chryseobacterium defluvii]MBB4807939.1 hypothetical protein [Chryseobacterium defluvii]